MILSLGGHCIGVDPYYLAVRANSVGYGPKVILSGRAVNEQMTSHIAEKAMRLMRLRGLVLKEPNKKCQWTIWFCGSGSVLIIQSIALFWMGF